MTVDSSRPRSGVAAHEGAFDLGDVGASAADFGGLEAIAEEGDTSGLVARFAAESNGNDDVILAPGGFAGAPVFDPGETITHQLMVDDLAAITVFQLCIDDHSVERRVHRQPGPDGVSTFSTIPATLSDRFRS